MNIIDLEVKTAINTDWYCYNWRRVGYIDGSVEIEHDRAVVMNVQLVILNVIGGGSTMVTQGNE